MRILTYGKPIEQARWLIAFKGRNVGMITTGCSIAEIIALAARVALRANFRRESGSGGLR